MDVALLKPPSSGILGLEMITFVEPLGLECVAGTLEPEGHACAIYDLRIDGLEAGMEKCRRFAPQVVGIQCNFTTERYRTIQVAKEVKRQNPGVFVVVGGHDASRDPGWFRDPSIDAVAVGDGEEIMLPLVDALERDRDLKTVPGLRLNRPHGQEDTGHAPSRRSLDDIPLPARHLLADYAPHYFINFRKPLALLETARGCPFKCNFCSVWKFHESTFREKSPQQVVKELASIEAPNIFITDDIFWMNVRRGHELADAIKASGIRKFFTVQTRTDIICRHPELIEKWAECGDLAIFLGVEKVDDAGLASVNKKNTASNNERAISILKDLGVGFTCNFIVDPSWDYEDFTRLREWIALHGTYNSGFSVLTPLPGTDLWKDVEADVNVKDWELFDIVHTVLPTKLPMDEFYSEYSRLWRTALEVRYQHRGKARTYFQLGAALATGRIGWGDAKRGWNLAKELSQPQTFLAGHARSAQQQAVL